MKTVAIISQKGGSGKTTIALHLAVAAAQGRVNVALIDLDPQASAAKWSDRRAVDLPVVLSVHASRLSNELKRVSDSGGEMVFLDTAPHSDNVAIVAAKAADFVLIPCRPAILDMEAIENTLALVHMSKTPVAVVLNGVAPNGSEWMEATEAIMSLGVQVCPARLVNRIAFSRSLITGQTAQEFEPEGKAAQEIEQLHKYTCAQLQKITTSHIGTNDVEQIRHSA